MVSSYLQLVKNILKSLKVKYFGFYSIKNFNNLTINR